MCGSTADGWYAPTGTENPLGTFEVNCYYFGNASTYFWDQAFKACIDLGGGSKLAVIETNAEFTWIMGMYTSLYSALDGLYVDATRGRYGPDYMIPAWRGGNNLSDSVGSVIIGDLVTPSYNGCPGPIYNHAFYLNSTGYVVDIFERSSINNGTNGGYLCKKFKTAPYPETVGYNLAHCFPSLVNNGDCPSGWTSFEPESINKFCYYPIYTEYTNHDEVYRQCYELGADLAYVESTSEYNMLVTNGWINSSMYVALNGNRFRYGPFGLPNTNTSLTWSNGITVAYPTSFGISWCSGNPNDHCSTESALQYYSCGLNDITPYFDYFGTTINPAIYWAMSMGICKRPQCGIRVNFIITIKFILTVSES